MHIPQVLKSKPVLYGGLAVAGIAGYMLLRGSGGGSATSDVGDGGISPSVAYGLPTVGSGGNNADTGTGFNLSDLLSLETAAQTATTELDKITAANKHSEDLAITAANTLINGKKILQGEFATVTATFLNALKLNTNITGIHANIGGTNIVIGLTKLIPHKKKKA